MCIVEASFVLLMLALYWRRSQCVRVFPKGISVSEVFCVIEGLSELSSVCFPWSLCC